MPRQPIQLTESQACALAGAMPAIIARHQPSNLNWRAFVDEFIRAVHAATGKTYSAPVYRRLLGEHAPGRAPSTDTLAAAKKDLERELATQARATAQVADSAPGPELGEVVARALARVLENAPRNTPESDLLRAQISYLQGQLEQAERDVLEVRGQAARLAGPHRQGPARRVRRGEPVQRLTRGAGVDGLITGDFRIDSGGAQPLLLQGACGVSTVRSMRSNISPEMRF